MAGFPGWQQALLKSIGAPATPENLRFLNAWQRSEGGGARYNPLNTTQHAPGAGSYNSVGVRNYRSAQQGLQATAHTLLDPRYQQIVGGLRSGRASAQQLAHSLGRSPWGTNAGLVLKVLGSGGGETGTAPTGLRGAVTAGATAPAVDNGAGQRALGQQLIANLQALRTHQAPDFTQTWALLSALRDSGTSTPSTPVQPRAPIGSPQTALAMGRISFASGADRGGVRTKSAVRRFVSEIAGLAGHPLVIGTGTNHSRLTVNGNVSDHWSGHAADIPATGATLIALGRDALIAAGMPRAKAMRQRGGLYNVNGHQIIFNTHIGGDHTNHLHVSAY